MPFLQIYTSNVILAEIDLLLSSNLCIREQPLTSGYNLRMRQQPQTERNFQRIILSDGHQVRFISRLCKGQHTTNSDKVPQLGINALKPWLSGI